MGECMDDETGSPDEPLWTPGTGPATGMEDLFTGSGSVLPGVSPSEGVGGGCLTSPGLGLGMADYFQGGVVPTSSHAQVEVDMSTADSVMSAAEVASMMCGTPSQVLGRDAYAGHVGVVTEYSNKIHARLDVSVAETVCALCRAQAAWVQGLFDPRAPGPQQSASRSEELECWVLEFARV